MSFEINSDRKIAAGLFVLAAVTFSWFFGGAGWNQDAHFDLTRALIERRSIHIDSYAGNTEDVSQGTDGHIYINKPPGVSFLAAVPYALVFAVENGLGLPVDRMTRTNAWIVTAATCGLCGAAIGVILFLYGRKRVGASASGSLAVSLAILFGTIIFSYSTMLFAHVPAALFLLLAVTLNRERPFAAGVAAGLATTCFYVCGLGAAILAVLALLRSPRAAGRFVAGVIPLVILLGLYHWICFGSPFRTAVEASTAFTQKDLIFGVLSAPTWEALYGISFSPYRGLFFASPVLLFALIGLLFMARRRELQQDVVAIGAISAAFFFIIGGFNGWSGGWAFGPRYLLPIIPLLGIPMLYLTRFESRFFATIWVGAALLSIIINFVATATDPMPSPDVSDPIRQYLIPAFLNGRIPEETRVKFPWYHEREVDKVSLPRDAGNLGEILTVPGGRTSVVPVFVWMAAGSIALIRAARTMDREPTP